LLFFLFSYKITTNVHLKKKKIMDSSLVISSQPSLYWLDYHPEGWERRKIMAIPRALIMGPAKTIAHLAIAVFIGIPSTLVSYSCFSRNFRYALLDLGEALGHLITFILDYYGCILVQYSPYIRKREAFEEPSTRFYFALTRLEAPEVSDNILNRPAIDQLAEQLAQLKQQMPKDNYCENMVKNFEERLAHLHEELNVRELSNNLQSGVAHLIDPKKLFLGRTNQFGGEESQSTCTSNAVNFLVSIFKFKNKNPDSIFIDTVIANGKEIFKQLLQEKKKTLLEIVTALPEDEREAFMASQGSDAMTTVEVLKGYEGHFGLPPRSPETQNLLENYQDRSNFFTRIYQSLANLADSHDAAGSTIICNKKTFAMAVIKDHEGKNQYAIFDSHGANQLNGSPNAFIYMTLNLEEAANYLALLIPYQKSEFNSATYDLSLEIKQKIEANLSAEGRNQVIFSFQIPVG
jgi:hypothetical protein